MQFLRDDNWLGSTLAYNRFRDHLTEINEMYWSFIPTAGFANYHASSHAPNTLTASIFSASGPDARRIPQRRHEWDDQFLAFQNWVRLSSLMSAASFLETFLSSAIFMALMSDPLRRLGRPKAIDGTTWLKLGVDLGNEQLLKGCVVGDWTQRASGYKKLFGTVPAEILSNIGVLDEIRVLRNSIGHTFGRPIEDLKDQLLYKKPPIQKLSEAKLKRWLSLVEAVAKDVEAHLSPFIGNFETIAHYHFWSASDDGKAQIRTLSSKRNALSKELGRLTGRSPGRDFCDQLIEYYSKA